VIAATAEIWIEAGTATIGDDHHYPEERPAHTVEIAGFWIDVHPVTNLQFAAFVDATGYTTDAERDGGNVFVASNTPVDLSRPSLWWQHDRRAHWRRPHGADLLDAEHDDHPVVQVTRRDAIAYATWVHRRLPTEAEWEWAAAAVEPLPPSWPLAADGQLLANVWLGEFPWKSLRSRPPGTMPVGSFAPNGNELFDMLGNVWEWTADEWTARHYAGASLSPCCSTTDQTALDAATVKGGSYLCAANYCARYRPAARHAQPQREATCHIGFRCARSPSPVE
jgi:formylglycine-generating enzyme required for sulfatase activity